MIYLFSASMFMLFLPVKSFSSNNICILSPLKIQRDYRSSLGKFLVRGCEEHGSGHEFQQHSLDNISNESTDESSSIGPQIPDLVHGQISNELHHDSQNHDHSHSHSHGHNHSHFHFHMDRISFRNPSRKVIARFFMVGAFGIAYSYWRRSRRIEPAGVMLVTLILGASEVLNFIINAIKRSMGNILSGWRRHSGLSQNLSNQSTSSSRAAQEADAVTWAGVGVNIGLVLFKLFAGIVGKSAALVSDAGHSLSDLLSDAVTLWAVRVGRLPPDEDHPYGHGRFEAVGALIISAMLMGAGYGIACHAYQPLVSVFKAMEFPPLSSIWKGSTGVYLHSHSHMYKHRHVIQPPTALAAVAALVSIIAKEALYRATALVANKHNSSVLMSNALHHRTDAISSVVALVAVIGAKCGAPLLDPLAGLAVAVMVFLTGIQVFQEAVSQLTDTADQEIRLNVAEVMRRGIEGVKGFDSIRSRQMGTHTLVDLTVQVDSNISASAAQQVAQRARFTILKELPRVNDAFVTTVVDKKPCPVANVLKSQSEVESDIRRILRQYLSEIVDVPNVLVHYAGMTTSVEVFIRVDPCLRVHEVIDIASNVKRLLLEKMKELCTVQVHLDLVETYMAVNARSSNTVNGLFRRYKMPFYTQIQ